VAHELDLERALDVGKRIEILDFGAGVELGLSERTCAHIGVDAEASLLH
jgi:hypothetical protein